MKYYTEKLYPFQDDNIQIIQSCKTKFYLTGGTVLSRKYLQHRYSDDLDFFVNADAKFREYIGKIEAKLSLNDINFSVITKADDLVNSEWLEDRVVNIPSSVRM